MPNVNLIEEEGTEGAISPNPALPTRKMGDGGGLTKIVLVLFILIIIVGGVFLLNKYGIVNLWGKKTAPVVAQVEQQPFPEEQYPEINFDVQQGTEQEAAGIEFIETPPIEDPKKPAAKLTPEPKQTAKVEPVETASKQLAGMKGAYTIQVSAHRVKAIADGQVKKLGEAGYPAYVEMRQYKSGTWYSVRIGRYQSINEAKKAVEGFAYELKTNYWIDKVRSQ